MLTIRKDQIDALGALLREDFEQRALRRLCSAFPARVEAMRRNEDIAGAITRWIDEAFTFGIRDQQQVLRYLDYSLVLGAAFPHGPGFSWAKAILEDQSLFPVERIALLDEHLIFSDARADLLR